MYKPVFPIKNDLEVPGLERLAINDTRKRSSSDIRSSLQRFLAAQALKKSTQEQPDGKAKTGDLDVVFDATTTNRFWFHER